MKPICIKDISEQLIKVRERGLLVTVMTSTSQRQPPYHLVNKANLVHNFS